MKSVSAILVRATASLALAFAAAAPLTAAAVTSADLPEAKRSLPGLYLEAKDVPAFIEQKGGSSKVLFVDVRTRAEAMYLGMPTTVDALVPYVETSEFMTDWDPQRNAYRLEPFADFVPEVERRLRVKHLSKDDVVVLICRSGDRSSRGANRLAESGFNQSIPLSTGSKGT